MDILTLTGLAVGITGAGYGVHRIFHARRVYRDDMARLREAAARAPQAVRAPMVPVTRPKPVQGVPGAVYDRYGNLRHDIPRDVPFAVWMMRVRESIGPNYVMQYIEAARAALQNRPIYSIPPEDWPRAKLAVASAVAQFIPPQPVARAAPSPANRNAVPRMPVNSGRTDDGLSHLHHMAFIATSQDDCRPSASSYGGDTSSTGSSDSGSSCGGGGE